MSGHDDPTINANEKSKDNALFQRVDQIKTHISRIYEKLIGYELFEELHADCKVFLYNPDKCEKMKRYLQQMVNQGLVKIGYSRKIEDVSVIEYHGHILFETPYQRREVRASFKILVPISF